MSLGTGVTTIYITLAVFYTPTYRQVSIIVSDIIVGQHEDSVLVVDDTKLLLSL